MKKDTLLIMDIRRNKFFRIYLALTKVKQQQFSLFVQKHKPEKNNLQQFLEAIEDRNLYVNEFTLDKSQLFARISEKSMYDDAIIRQHFFELNQVLASFLLLEHHRNVYPYFTFIEIFNELGLEREVSDIIFDFEKVLASKPKDDKMLTQKYNLLQYKNDLDIQKGKRDDGSISRQMMDTLDEFYFSQKLRLACILLNNKNIWAQEKEIVLLNEIVQTVSVSGYFHNPYIALYFSVYQLLTLSQPDNLLEQSERIIIENKDAMDAKSLREIFIIIQNFCIRKLKEGGVYFEQKLFDIYKRQIELGLIAEKNIVSPWTYKNIITISFRLKEYEWAKNFMTAYKDFLPEGERENAYNYNLANYYFRTGNYEKSMRLLQRLEFTDLFYKLGSKLILLKIYFELNEEEAFENHCISFKGFLTREKKLNIEQRRPYINQIKFSHLIFQNRHHRRNLKLIEQKIQKNSTVADIHWLIEQINIRKNITKNG